MSGARSTTHPLLTKGRQPVTYPGRCCQGDEDKEDGGGPAHEGAVGVKEHQGSAQDDLYDARQDDDQVAVQGHLARHPARDTFQGGNAGEE